MEQPIIVCLCGSTRFHKAFRENNLRETLAGRIVLSIGIDTRSDEDLLLAGFAGGMTLADKERLDLLHLQKISLADEVLVLNVQGYIGESTARELAYAREQGKIVRFLELCVNCASPAEAYCPGCRKSWCSVCYERHYESNLQAAREVSR
ncbi:MAG: hypothetical protein ACRDHW_07125 [Ktedonobacteraceae bacterium]